MKSLKSLRRTNKKPRERGFFSFSIFPFPTSPTSPASLPARNHAVTLAPSLCTMAVAPLVCLVAVLVSVLMSPPALATSLAKSTVDLRLDAACCCAWTLAAAVLDDTVLVMWSPL